MTLGQKYLIENFNSLKAKTTSNNLGLMIQFCSLLQSDDVELFLEFKNKSISSPTKIITSDDLIELYAKRYGLDEEKDITKIMYIFIQNAINDGISYHLGSSANFSSIMELGLGLSAIGLKTEEIKDYEYLQSNISPELFRRIQPFSGEKKDSKLFYSNIPILNARYGDRPEWLQELKLNKFMLEDDWEAMNMVDQVLKKYDLKYNDSKKVLFLIPNPVESLSEEIIDKLLEKMTPKQIIQTLYHRVIEQKDLFTDKHIPGSYILGVDLNTFDLYSKNEYGVIEKVEPDLTNDNNKKY